MNATPHYWMNAGYELRLNNPSAVADASAILHDARILPGRYYYDRLASSVELLAWQRDNRLWWEWRLALLDVVGWRARHREPKANHSYHEISDLVYKGERRMLVLFTHYDLTLFAKFRREVDGYLTRTGMSSEDGPYVG